MVEDMNQLQSPVDYASNLAATQMRQSIYSQVALYKSVGHSAFVQRFGYKALKELTDATKANNISFAPDYTAGELLSIATNELLFGIPALADNNLRQMSQYAAGSAKIAKVAGFAGGMILPLGPGAKLVQGGFRAARMGKIVRGIRAAEGEQAAASFLKAVNEIKAASGAGREAAAVGEAIMGLDRAAVKAGAKASETLTSALRTVEKQLAGKTITERGKNFLTSTLGRFKNLSSATGEGELLSALRAAEPAAAAEATAAAAGEASKIADWARRPSSAVFESAKARAKSLRVRNPNLAYNPPVSRREARLLEKALKEKDRVNKLVGALKEEDLARLQQQIQARRELLLRVGERIEPSKMLTYGTVGALSGGVRGAATGIAESPDEGMLDNIGAGIIGGTVGAIKGGFVSGVGGTASAALGGSRIAMTIPGAGALFGVATGQPEVTLASLSALAGMSVGK